MAEEQFWYQVYRLRQGQLEGDLYDLMPICAPCNVKHHQWLGTGYYLWNEIDIAFDWGSRKFLAKHETWFAPREMVCSKIEVTGLGHAEIFDPQVRLDHMEDLNWAYEQLMRSPKIKAWGYVRVGSWESFVCAAMDYLSKEKILQNVGFKAVTYSELLSSERKNGKLWAMSENTPHQGFQRIRKQLCILPEYRALMRKVEQVRP